MTPCCPACVSTLCTANANQPTITCCFRSRREAREKAAVHIQSGNFSAALDCYQRAVDVTPAMAKQVIEVRLSKEAMSLAWEVSNKPSC